jgi:hypothetical protein
MDENGKGQVKDFTADSRWVLEVDLSKRGFSIVWIQKRVKKLEGDN